MWIAPLVLLAVAGCTARGSEARPESSVAAASRSASPSGAVDSARAEAPGPRDAALTYVASTDTLMGHSPIGRADILETLLTPMAAGEHAASLADAAEAMASTMGVPTQRLEWVEAPLSAAVRTQHVASATVDVWTVSVLGAPETGPPQQAWRTVSVDLELVDGVWLVSAATAQAGPTPASNELALQAGWDEFETVAGWEPVVAGVGLSGGDD